MYFFINILVLYVQKLNQTKNILWRVLQTEKRYFAPAENFYASHSFPNAPSPYSGAALCPVCPIQLHVCHSTSSIPSRSPEKQNQPVCAHSRALPCSSAPPIGVLKQECLGAAGLCSPPGAHRSALLPDNVVVQRLRDMANRCGFRAAGPDEPYFMTFKQKSCFGLGQHQQLCSC